MTTLRFFRLKSLLGLLVTLQILGFGPASASAMAQVPFDECGIIVSDPTGFCPLFESYVTGSTYLIDIGTVPIPPPGTEIQIIGTVVDCVATCFPTACIFDATLSMPCSAPPPPQPRFIRGDCNNDSSFNIADVIFHLFWLFASGPLPPCHNACDFDSDQNIDIGDGVTMLATLFNSGAPPAPPWPDCGIDPVAPTSPTCEDPICP
ncbi:MAG: hypothetical protein AAEJ04_11515 [Planctomycetota bacterium]